MVKMKKFGLIILILTAVCILALAFLEDKIFPDDSLLHSSSTESQTTESQTTESQTTESSSSSPAPVCVHEWIFESTTVTCSRDGEKLYRCSKCGETRTEEDPAYGCYDEDKNGRCDGCGIETGECEHKIVTEKGDTPTCLQEGLTDKRYCSKCDMILEEHTAVPALGHQEKILAAVPSTCIAEGLTEGAICSRCDLVLTPQVAVPMIDHVENEGVCTGCGKIMDAKSALGFYIVRNGTKQTEGERYFISKSAEKMTYTGIVRIEFDPTTLELVFSGESTTLGISGDMTMSLDMSSHIQKVGLKGTYEGTSGYANGTINAKTFSSQNMNLETFEYDAGNRTEDEQWYKMCFCIAVSEMLLLSAEMIEATGTGVTMPMLGFPNY